MATATTTEREVKPSRLGRLGIGGSTNGSHNNGGGDGGDNKDKRRPAPNKYHLAMWLALASIAMMFMAFTSAYVIRMGDDWAPISIPSALWLSTGVLLTSSFTIELARKALKRGLGDLFKRWLWVTTFLGIAFLVGQLLAWRQLAVKGIYLSTNPHSSFFYVLTAAHGLHLLGGIIALLFVGWGRLRRLTLATATEIAGY